MWSLGLSRRVELSGTWHSGDGGNIKVKPHDSYVWTYTLNHPTLENQYVDLWTGGGDSKKKDQRKLGQQSVDSEQDPQAVQGQRRGTGPKLVNNPQLK